MDKEDTLKFEIIEQAEVPDEAFAEIQKGLSEEGITISKDELVQMTIKVEGREQNVVIIGFKTMLLSDTTGDVAVRMTIAQLLENEEITNGNTGQEN